MIDKRPIDKLRESAVGMTVGDASDGAITGMITIAERLYVIKEKAIYLLAMADEIDPQRTRADIPNTQQLVLNSGSNSESVRRILLTARELFREHRLIEMIDWNAVLLSALEILKDVIAAQETSDEFIKLKVAADAAIIPPQERAFRMPAISGLEGRVKSFIQKTEHAFQGLYKTCALFYPEEMQKAGKWLDGFAAVVETRYGNQDEFTLFAKELANFGKIIRNARHCVEHPKTTQQLEVRDYQLTADRILEEPMIRVIHNDTPIERMPLGQFMEEVTIQLHDAAELLLAYLAAKHTAALGQFQVAVGEIPENQRGNDGVRFGYLINIGGTLQRLG
ncbi:hypothetical protein [Nitratireductor sp. ZSWI3]|uniref:hypothetical protein n=1 Tax=Nitratireductor sp. ZSWI3 TaxID=2966359 RepID=UPI0021502197|nr:hypothetical protein [Nitratireductor sp. ZSWI3]MCR4268269.1 hypothetical protein [Nitratireductor sp. ZSWI3]